jgi:hypothetical protein
MSKNSTCVPITNFSQISMIKGASIGETSIGSNRIVINLMITISFCKKKHFEMELQQFVTY